MRQIVERWEGCSQYFEKKKKKRREREREVKMSDKKHVTESVSKTDHLYF